MREKGLRGYEWDLVYERFRESRIKGFNSVLISWEGNPNVLKKIKMKAKGLRDYKRD